MMERLTDKTRNFDGTASSPKSLVIEEGMRKGMPSAYCNAIVTKLAEYEDAEEQGLLLRLPCKAKSIVYLLDHSFFRRKHKPFKCEIDEFIIADDGCYAVLNGIENFYMMRRFKAIPIRNFGLTIFTSEEAALKKMQEDNQ